MGAVFVIRCPYCKQTTPVDRDTCRHCGSPVNKVRAQEAVERYKETHPLHGFDRLLLKLLLQTGRLLYIVFMSILWVFLTLWSGVRCSWFVFWHHDD